MRVNVYAEEMTDRIEIVEKNGFTGLRIYLELPVTVNNNDLKDQLMGKGATQVKGPFIHHEGDDDSSAVTFWGKADLRDVLAKALDMLTVHYANRQAVTDNKSKMGEGSGEVWNPIR